MAFLNVFKPNGITSHDCVAKLRTLLKTKRVGHGGTLDPMATGVLVIAFNRATRFLPYLETTKEYIGDIRFGITTDSDDITGKVLTQSPAPYLTQNEVVQSLKQFIGEIDQLPPRVSAIRTNGKRYYEYARANKEFEIKSRRVTIHDIQVLNFVPGEYPEVKIKVQCASGTYIRSIARECGEHIMKQNVESSLPIGGTLTSLIRTQNGLFRIENSINFDEIQTQLQSNTLLNHASYCSIEQGLMHLPKIYLSPELALAWKQGRYVCVKHNDILPPDNVGLHRKYIAPTTVEENNENDSNDTALRIYSNALFLGVAHVHKESSTRSRLGKRVLVEI